MRVLHVPRVPPGRWGVGVSGGGDSVALLSILRQAPVDLSLHVIHLDHQTRGEESAADARFVAELAARWSLPCTIARRDQIEPQLTDPPDNPSALYRALRLELFRKTVQAQRLAGVILAHHADDQAETIFQRLLRGSRYPGLSGMSRHATVGGLVILRPLLTVDRAALRAYLTDRQLTWREDSSNRSEKYLRNRLRNILARFPGMRAELLSLGGACAGLRQWVRSHAPMLNETFAASELAHLPRLLGEQSARQWLIARGVPAGQIEPAAIDRLLTMASDAASPPRQEFPGRVRIRRRGGCLFVEPR
jgi:tRNA(Ile)-lysidine synthetase-like protein